MYRRGGLQLGQGKGTVRKESRRVEENKRNFGDGKFLLISRGQAYIPYKNGDVQNFYT